MAHYTIPRYLFHERRFGVVGLGTNSSSLITRNCITSAVWRSAERKYLFGTSLRNVLVGNTIPQSEFFLLFVSAIHRALLTFTIEMRGQNGYNYNHAPVAQLDRATDF